MVFIGGIGNSAVSLYRDTDGVLGFGVGDVFYGYCMMLWGQLYVWLHFSTINKQLVVFRTLYVQLSLYEISVVDIKRQYSATLAVFKGWEYLSAECCCSRRQQTNAVEHRLLVKPLSLYIDRIDAKGCVNSHRT